MIDLLSAPERHTESPLSPRSAASVIGTRKKEMSLLSRLEAGERHVERPSEDDLSSSRILGAGVDGVWSEGSRSEIRLEDLVTLQVVLQRDTLT